MTTPNNEIIITETAMRKVLANDENLRLKCLVESLHEKVIELNKELSNCNGSCKGDNNARNEEKETK